MDFGETAQAARYDQARAAQSDVVGILGVIARKRQRWSRIDESTHVRIESLLERFFAFDADRERVCPHARQAAFDRAPRPLVLDSVSGILACWDGCYWRAFSAGSPRRRLDAKCFSCDRGLGEFVGGPDLFIAYGPILVVGALCQQCRDLTPTGSASASDLGS